jgi:hypothetical protein
MIPEKYLSHYQLARARSHQLAEAGEISAGYTELLEQWEGAMCLQEKGTDWAFPLSILYLAAMDEYCEAYWPAPPPAAPAEPVLARDRREEAPQMRRAIRKGRQDVARWREWLRARRPRTR